MRGSRQLAAVTSCLFPFRTTVHSFSLSLFLMQFLLVRGCGSSILRFWMSLSLCRSFLTSGPSGVVGFSPSPLLPIGGTQVKMKSRGSLLIIVVTVPGSSVVNVIFYLVLFLFSRRNLMLVLLFVLVLIILPSLTWVSLILKLRVVHKSVVASVGRRRAKFPRPIFFD